jgi:hypothetical protein
MNKKIIRQFEEQFGREWECSCKQPFGLSNLEIISESNNSLLAHYICPQCGKEQMLAASISEEKQIIEEEISSLQTNQITSDDLLDIRKEIQQMKLAGVRALYRIKNKKETKVSSDNLSSSKLSKTP